MIDSKKRTMAKALSWRVLGFTVLSVLSYLVTGSLKQMTMIALIYQVFMLSLYLAHERTWNSLSWGRTKGLFIQMTGMSGAGKSTLSNEVAKRLRKKGFKVEIIDGDEYRTGLCGDLGFSKEDRNTNIRRLGFVSKILARNNVISIIAAINPYDSVRQELNNLGSDVKTVYVKCDIKTLKIRDTKGLYKRALLKDGHPDKVYNFTGISDPFEEPNNPDLVLLSGKESLQKSANKLEKFILKSIS